MFMNNIEIKDKEKMVVEPEKYFRIVLSRNGGDLVLVTDINGRKRIDMIDEGTFEFLKKLFSSEGYGDKHD
ncbi:MAG: hypothetical protein ACP5T9_05290 [Thermoplasmata archaeon]